MTHIRKHPEPRAARRGYSTADLAAALDSMAVAPASVLMVHSSLYHLGRLHGVAIRDTTAAVVDTLCEHLGACGTLVVPAPNWDYGAKRQPFDIATSPVTKALGVFSAHVVALPDRQRSANPIFSVAAVGARAAEICGGYSTNAFGQESPWQRMVDLDADMLCLGTDFEYLTFIRYMETRFGVPYLYNKFFDVPVLYGGVPIPSPVVAPLRYAHLPIRYDPRRFTQRCRAAGILREVALGDGTAMAIRMQPCFEVGMAALREDLHAFLAEAPAYRGDMVPRA